MNDSHVEISLNASHWSFGQSASLWFRTRETDGLLMYSGRKPGEGNVEFLLLDITSGKARFTADLGSGIVSTIVVKCCFNRRSYHNRFCCLLRKFVLRSCISKFIKILVKLWGLTPNWVRHITITAENVQITLQLQKEVRNRMKFKKIETDCNCGFWKLVGLVVSRNWFLFFARIDTIGSLRYHDGDGHENVT